MRTLVLGMLLGLLSMLVQAGQPAAAEAVAKFDAYSKVVAETAGMVRNAEAQQLARQHGLQVLNVTWEDTGRYKGSSVGPNISDMTIQVQQMNPNNEKCALTCMPVIRHDNFSDKSADISPEKFFLLVGNEEGKELSSVSLKDILGDLRSYLHTPTSWKGTRTSLLAARDTHVLVSAQACFLPVPKAGNAEFNPVLFNYQSYEGDPAVLTILATREGTSVTVIDNKRDGFQAGRTWGLRLFFNKNGERCSFTGQRMSDFLTQNGGSDTGPSTTANGQQGLNMVLLIQVPLKQKQEMSFKAGCAAPCAPEPKSDNRRMRGDVEAAVIGHGKVEGPFTEIADLDIERDERFPVRVTVQFYKATSNGVVEAADMADIADQIGKVYANADYVGSLVTQGETGRPTEYSGSKVQPSDWWERFWDRHHKNTGQTRAEALTMVRKLRGDLWLPKSEKELIEAVGALK